MSNEKVQEEFEAWASIKFAVDVDLLAASRTGEDMDDGFPYRIVNKHGEQSDLANTLVGTAWAGWQASRDAELEMPEPYAVIGNYAACGGGRSVWDVEYAAKITDRMCEKTVVYDRAGLEAAGFKVKP